MAIEQRKEVTDKLNSVPVKNLRELAKLLSIDSRGRHGDIVMRLIDQDMGDIDDFIKLKYQEKVAARRNEIISDADLISELHKVESIEWGVVQGQLDSKIQREYVRRYTQYDELIQGVQRQLHREITNYTIASWYNHWSTVLIEDRISLHVNVVPTLKNIAGIDIFFRNCPFDLKITYLPRNYDLTRAIEEPHALARWLYEHQGAQRFGADNRFYVVVADTEDITQSWRLKRDIGLLSQSIDRFLDTEVVTSDDRIAFVYNGVAHSVICKTLLITR